jgi:outer membrane protein OmpA-like peptidoglycan-associated protein
MQPARKDPGFDPRPVHGVDGPLIVSALIRNTRPSPRFARRTLAWLAVLPVLAFAPAFAGSSASRQVASAASTPPPIHSSAPIESARESVANDLLPPIHFAAGTTGIRPSDTKILDAHAVWLQRDLNRILLIEGHTDGPGDSPFSRGVGQQRAQSAKTYLVSRGALPDRIMISSRGGGWPACQEKTAPCRAINRRATFSAVARP